MHDCCTEQQQIQPTNHGTGTTALRPHHQQWRRPCAAPSSEVGEGQSCAPVEAAAGCYSSGWLLQADC